MDDLISRQAAIDALEREKTYSTAYKGGYTQTDYFKQYNMGLTDGIKALNKLPSAQSEIKCVAKVTLTDEQVKEAFEKAKCEILAAQPERRWIPTEEALPDEWEECWITPRTTPAVYKGVFTRRYGSQRDTGFICCACFMQIGTALAWMPRDREPEPYEDGEQDG